MLFIGKRARNKFLKIVFAFWVVGLLVLWGEWLPFSATLFSQPALSLARAQDYSRPFVFGPYVPLSPGKYQVTFTLKAENNKTTHPIVRLEVTSEQAQRVFVSKTIGGTDFRFPGRYQNFDLQFETTAGGTDFEFKISYYGASKLWAEKIAVTQLQGYSEQEAMGTDLVRGYSKNKIIPETESLLKGSKQKDMRIDDKRLSRRIGYSVFDPQAASGRAWLVKPNMGQIIEAPAPASPVKIKFPKIVIKIPKVRKLTPVRLLKTLRPWMMFVFGIITGYILSLINTFVYRRILSKLRQLKRKLSSWTLRDIKAYVLRQGKYSALVILAIGIIISVYSENLVLFGFVVKGIYMFAFYILLSIIWNSDPRIMVALGLVLLASSSLLLTLGQEQLAERAAIYVYYLLILGIVFRLVEHARQSQREKKQLAEIRRESTRQVPDFPSRKDPTVPQTPTAANQAYVSGERPSNQALNKVKRLAIVVSAVFLMGVVITWGAFFHSRSGNLKIREYSGKPLTEAKRAVVLGGQVKEEKIDTSTEAARARTPEPVRIDKSKIKLEVSNGNGIPGEAARIALLLKKLGYDVLEIKNMDKFDRPRTTVRYKPGQKYTAEVVAKEIGTMYVAAPSEDLPSSNQADIVIILGKERANNGATRIQVLNGNGMKGEAGKIENKLKLHGFNVLASKNADRTDYPRTVIRHKPDQRYLAELVAFDISDSYLASLEEDLPSNSPAEVIVILGRDKIHKS